MDRMYDATSISTPAVCAAVLWGLACTADAATIHVPADFADIQSAVDAAADGDVILVAPGTWTGTGQSAVDIFGKSITLRATGSAAETILDGEGTRRVIALRMGFDTESHVIDGFTITNGRSDTRFGARGPEGGGVYCSGHDLLVKNCIFSNNLTTDNGGGLYMDWSDAIIVNCTFTGNTAGRTLTENLEGPYTFGGAIYGHHSDVTVTDCLIDGNSASGGGGILLTRDSALHINTSRIRSNAAINGGGIHMHISTLHMVECIVSSNATWGLWGLGGQGGGVFIDDSPSEITNTTFQYNTSMDGGGLYFNRSTCELSGCTVSDSHASRNGVGLYAYEGAVTISDCTLTRNTAASADPQFVTGGGVYLSGGHHAIRNSSISHHTGFLTGGGINCSADSSSTLSLSDTLLCDNGDDPINGNYTDEGGNELLAGCASECYDVTGDTRVSTDDLLSLLLVLGTTDAEHDFDHTGRVDIRDLMLLLLTWGGCG